MKTKIVTTLATAVSLSAMLVGCATTGGAATGPSDSPARGSNALSEEEPSPVESESSTEESREAQRQVVSFGDTYTREDGLSVTVGKPQAWSPSEYAAGGREPDNVRFTITVVNDTGAIYDPSMFFTTMQSGNQEAEEVYDSENDVGGSPSTKILPGREARFDQAYNVAAPRDLSLEVTPGWDYEPAIYASRP